MKYITLLTGLLFSTLALNAEIKTLKEARILLQYLNVIKQHDSTLFKDPVVKDTVSEVITFFGHHQDISEQEKIKIEQQLEEFITLLADTHDDLPHKGSPLLPGQTLITYWSQIFTLTQTFFDDTGSTNFSLSAPPALQDSYVLQFPVNQGSSGQVLSTNGANPAQLSWVNTVTDTAQLNLLYSATACDIPHTLVLRDATGSFAATTITLTGNSLINYSALGGCDTGAGFVWAPTYYNTLIGLGAGASNTITGSNNVALGFEALMSSELGERNIAIGSGALYSNYNGTQNIGIGYQALFNNDSDASGRATDNIAIGSQALYSNIYSAENIAIGSNALASLTEGVSGHVALGYYALNAHAPSAFVPSEAYSNTALGFRSLENLTSGYTNIAIGALSADTYVSDESSNIVIGTQAIAGDQAVTRIGYWRAQDDRIQTVSCFVSGIYDTPIYPGQLVSVDENGQLGYDSTSLVATATACDVPHTLVLRDTTGSFAATTITLTGNSLINYSALGGCDTGAGFVWAPTYYNTLIGLGAGTSNLNGQNNVAIGYDALLSNASGDLNIAVGRFALGSNTSGNSNIAIGYDALASNLVNYSNIAIGTSALSLFNNIPFGNGNNMAIGDEALISNVTGIFNIALGASSLSGIITGSYNIALGVLSAGNYGTNESGNIVIGTQAIAGDELATRIGYWEAQDSLQTVSCFVSGIYNTPVTGQLVSVNQFGQLGYDSTSLVATATPCDFPNTLVLRDATGNFAATTITLTGNSLINYSELGGCDEGQGFVWAPTYYNTLIGLGAGASNTITGSNNVALGFEALMSSYMGARNIAIGSGALQYAYDAGDQPLQDHIAIGYQALQNVNNGPVGETHRINLALGNFALTNNVDGNYNIAVGHESLYSNSEGSQNIGIGYQALFNNDSDASGSATDNIAIGSQALYSNIDSAENIAIGSNALASLVERGFGHVALGYYALNAFAPSSAMHPGVRPNTALGYQSLENVTGGFANIAIGALSADNYVSDEARNIVIGTKAIAGDDVVTRIGYWLAQDSIQTSSCFVSGIYDTPIYPGQLVSVDSKGQLGYDSTSLVATATPCDIPLTLVLRDTTGSFVATTITLTGNSLINYSTDICDPSEGYIWAPTNQNTLIGLGTGNSSRLTGVNNVAIGYETLTSVTSGYNNVVLGALAAQSITTGFNNIAVGTQALMNAQGVLSSGNYVPVQNNIAVGYQALMNTLGGNFSESAFPYINVAVGNYALTNNTYGFYNLAVGNNALQANINGYDNTAVGLSTLTSNTSGGQNTAIGRTSLSSLIYGAGNIAVGYGSGSNYFSSESYNIALGTQAMTGDNQVTRLGFWQNNGDQVNTNACYIAGIYSTPITPGQLVSVNSLGQLGYDSTSLVATATSFDIPNTLVLRDNTGSFASTNITLTGALKLQGASSNTVAVQAPASGSYALILPTSVGTNGQVLVTAGTNPDQLSWITTVTSATQLNWLYTATSADIPNTLVLRDTTGSFVSTNITLTGCLIVDDNNLNTAGTICGSTSALSVAPQGTRALQATKGGNTRGTNAVDLQINNGTSTIASGNYSVISGGSSNTAQGQYDVIAGGQNNSTTITSNDPQAGYNMIMTGSKNSIAINDIVTGSTNICGYNSIGGASNSIIISTTAATVSGLTAGFNAISSGNQNSITIALPASNFTANTVTQAINVGGNPYGIAITPNNLYACVANLGSGTVNIINTITNAVTSVPVGSQPKGIAITPNSQYAYVANYASNTVSVIDIATNSNIGTITLIEGGEPTGIAITPDGQYAYVTNFSNNSVSIINTKVNTSTAYISVPGPDGIAITPNGQYAYVTNFFNNTVSVINLATNGVSVISSASFSNPTGIAITPNGQYAYVANNSGNTVSVINLTTNTVITTINSATFNSPNGIAITPNGEYAYVTNSDGTTVSIINLATNSVTATIGVQNAPTGIAITPNGEYIFVSNEGSGTVSEIFLQLPSQGENFIGGGAQNTITVSPQTTSVGQHVIVGGLSNTITCTNNGMSGGSFIGGGSSNTISSSPGVICGGNLNTISQNGYLSAIGGGQSNIASGPFSTIAGGYGNGATGIGASILGGVTNQASGNYSMVGGGQSNIASGNSAVALGYNALAGYNNSFVWADGQSSQFAAPAANTFNIRASGGLYGTLGTIQLYNNGQTSTNVLVGPPNNITTSGVTAVGYNALANNTANNNTAVGYYALDSNTTGTGNVAIGSEAASTITTGNGNLVLGTNAGSGITTANNVIAIGQAVAGKNTSNTTYIGGISGTTTSLSTGVPVYIDSSGNLGTSNGNSDTLLGGGALAGGPANNSNTAIGDLALGFFNSGSNNVGVGVQSLLYTQGSNNIGIGLSAGQYLGDGVTSNNNTIIGAAAMAGFPVFSSTNNVAIGYYSLYTGPVQGALNNITAVGAYSLYNAQGPSIQNTALGYYSLESLTTGTSNTALGYYALKNTTGYGNTVVGAQAGTAITSGNNNTIIGTAAANNLASGSSNILIGPGAGSTVTGSSNIMIGNSGTSNTSGSGNVYIGQNGIQASESNVIRISSLTSAPSAVYIIGINGAIVSGGTEVFVSPTTQQLGTSTSSKKYKENIVDIGDLSQKIYQFRPVYFNYIKDPEKWFEAGLIAEEVHEIMPEIVVYKDGEPETIRYKQLPIMMLNEQQKDHKLLKELEEKNKQLEKIISELVVRMEKLEARA